MGTDRIDNESGGNCCFTPILIKYSGRGDSAVAPSYHTYFRHILVHNSIQGYVIDSGTDS